MKVCSLYKRKNISEYKSETSQQLPVRHGDANDQQCWYLGLNPERSGEKLVLKQPSWPYSLSPRYTLKQVWLIILLRISYFNTPSDSFKIFTGDLSTVRYGRSFRYCTLVMSVMPLWRIELEWPVFAQQIINRGPPPSLALCQSNTHLYTQLQKKGTVGHL